MSLPTRVMISLFCGPERDHWINPGLSRNVMQFLAGPEHGGWSRPDFAVAIDHVFGLRPIEWARNYAVDRFLKSGGAWLVMIDNDHHFTKGDPLTMLRYAEREPEIDIVSLAPFQPDGRYFRFPDRIGFTELPEGYFGGSGVMFIRRHVFEKLAPPWFEFVHDPRTRELKLGEDQHFCRKAIAAGLRIHTYTAVKISHLHSSDVFQSLAPPKIFVPPVAVKEPL